MLNWHQNCLTICITFPDKYGKCSTQINVFKIWPRMGYWFSSQYWKNRGWRKRVERVTCIRLYAYLIMPMLLTFRLRFLEAAASDICLQTGYSDRFSSFYSVFADKFWDSALNWDMTAPFCIFATFITHYSIIVRFTMWTTDSVFKWTTCKYTVQLGNIGPFPQIFITSKCVSTEYVDSKQTGICHVRILFKLRLK